MNKVLACTAWSPTHSEFFHSWGSGVAAQDPDEIFITTHFAEDKFDSIVGAMEKARKYALSKDFTHLMNIEADHKLPFEALDHCLTMDKDVVIMAGRYGVYMEKPEAVPVCSFVTSCVGWGSMVVRRSVMEVVPFDVFKEDRKRYGDPLWPDIGWYRAVIRRGFEIWYDYRVMVDVMQKPNPGIQKSFAVGLKE
jgi:hypothetical protein